MIYHTLDESTYQNSRYELIQLLEEIYPTKECGSGTAEFFNRVAHYYESLIDEYFPGLPFSEERLAIFCRVYSETGFVSETLVHAVKSGARTIIVTILQAQQVTDGCSAN